MAAPERRLVIGDIHGLLKPLQEVLERAAYSPKKDKLIFLGDYVDRGLQSAQVVSYLLKIQEKAKHKPVFLVGNHDVWCQDWLNRDEISDAWLRFGGMETLESYDQLSYSELDKHRDFFNALLPFHIEKDKKAFVHGGYLSDLGLGDDLDYVYYNDRSIARMIGQHAEEREGIKQLPARLRHYKELYIGHTPTLKFGYDRPLGLNNKYWMMDTGPIYGGRLYAMDIDSKKLYRSKKRDKLYPLYY